MDSFFIYKYYNINTDDSLRRLDNIQLVISATLNYSEHYQYQTPNPTIGTGNASLLVASITYKKNDIITATHTFTYDKLYNITSIIIDNNGSNDESYAYTYDYLNRLIREDITTINYSGYRTYEYDLRGNITSIQVWEYRQNGEDIVEVLIADKLITYKTEGWKDQISTLSEQLEGESVATIYTYTYDEIGNVTKISVSDNDYDTFSWDGRRLKQYIKDGVTYSYTYNDEGIRTSKTIDGIKTTYFLDGYNVLIEKTNGNVIYYTYDADGSLLSMNYNGTEYFYIKNMQGDIIELVNVLGDSIAKYRYDAWGNIIYQYDSGLGIADINPYRYRGYRFDIETGLYYLNARYYDSNIGRFISSDSISYLDPSSEAGLNLYAYCNNNPVLNVDPTGCFCWSTFWVGVGLVTTAVIAVAVSVATLGAATPLAMAAIASVTLTAGILTGINGVATLVESGTDYNFVRDGIFSHVLGLDDSVYNTYSTITETIAIVGSIVCSAFNITNPIKGFTNHGLESALTHDAHGVSAKAMQDAVRNPIEVINQSNGAIKYIGKNAVVVLNKIGKVITTFAKNNHGWRF